MHSRTYTPHTKYTHTRVALGQIFEHLVAGIAQPLTVNVTFEHLCHTHYVAAHVYCFFFFTSRISCSSQSLLSPAAHVFLLLAITVYTVYVCATICCGSKNDYTYWPASSAVSSALKPVKA